MGYALPAAMGAKLAAPHRTAVAICGDGSFQMQMMELATLCQHGVEGKLIVMNNRGLGMIREMQQTRYRKNIFSVALDGSPDLKKIAAAYGIGYRRIVRDAQIHQALQEMLHAKGPFILECSVSPASRSYGF